MLLLSIMLSLKLCNPRNELDHDSKQLLQATFLCGREQLKLLLYCQ